MHEREGRDVDWYHISHRILAPISDCTCPGSSIGRPWRIAPLDIFRMTDLEKILSDRAALWSTSGLPSYGQLMDEAEALERIRKALEDGATPGATAHKPSRPQPFRLTWQTVFLRDPGDEAEFERLTETDQHMAEARGTLDVRPSPIAGDRRPAEAQRQTRRFLQRNPDGQDGQDPH